MSTNDIVKKFKAMSRAEFRVYAQRSAKQFREGNLNPNDWVQYQLHREYRKMADEGWPKPDFVRNRVTCRMSK